MSFRDPMLRRKDAVSFAPGGSQSTRGPMTLLSYVLGGLPRSSVVVAGTNTSTFSDTPDLALVKAVIAHAARRAESEDIVVAVFDVRRSYVYAEEKRETPLLSCRTVYLPNSGQRMLGSCARRCTELAQLQHRGEMSREKGSSVAVSPLALCRVAASTKCCAPSRGRCMATTFLSLVLVRV